MYKIPIINTCSNINNENMPYTCVSGYGKKAKVRSKSSTFYGGNKMDKVAMIKQAYAYGAAVALHELGYDVNTAQNAGVKLAEDEEGMHPALRALIGTGAGIGGGALLGAGLGAGGAALANKFSPSRAGRLTDLGAAHAPGLMSKMLPESLQGVAGGTGAISNAAMAQRLKREALLGAEAGGAALGGLGGIGGGLYGGLSE